MPALPGRPGAARHPFILTSAGIPRKDLAIPCDVFLKKPIRFEALLAEIDQLTAARGQR